MRIGTAEPDSTFLTQGQALAAVLPQHGAKGPFEVLVSPAASIDNANRLDRGEIDLGFMAANWIGRAKRGEPPFKQPIDLRMVAPMNVGPLFFIARADSGIATFDDLAGKRVSVGPAGSGMAQHAHTMFGALGYAMDGIVVVHRSFADGARDLAEGRIDAQLQCPIPNKVMTQLDADNALNVLRYSEAQLTTLLDRVPFYRRAVMRKSTLRALKEDVAQPGVLNVLVCHARADSGRIAQVAAAIRNGAGELGRRNALFGGLDDLFKSAKAEGPCLLEPDGVKLHHGAAKSYASLGLLGS